MAIGVAIALAGCSTSDSVSTGAETTATAAQPATTGAGPSTPDTTAPGNDDIGASSLVELRSDLAIDVLELDATTETGRHPTLSWRPVDNANSYWLVVRDAEGRAFWAWTGTDTSVRVGGGDTPDVNQTAAVHEAMTWRVAAFDANGRLVALSDEGFLAP